MIVALTKHKHSPQKRAMQSSRIAHCTVILRDVAKAAGVDAEDITTSNRSDHFICDLRDRAMYRCRIEAEATYNEIAWLFNLGDPRSVHYAIQKLADPEARARRLDLQRQRDTAKRTQSREMKSCNPRGTSQSI